LFILGDFIDGRKLRSRWRWTPVYSEIVNRLFDLAESGTELFYTPGNHDDFLRQPEVAGFLAKSGIHVHVRDEFVFETLDGRRLLAFHGDKFDVVEMRHQWLSNLLTYAYEPLLSLNYWFNRLTSRQCSPYSTCAAVKHKVKLAVRFLSHFEEKLSNYVRERGCDGVVCGHLHTPRLANLGELTYINTGDWVENCTALVEHSSGALVLESFFADPIPNELRPTEREFRSRVPSVPSAADTDYVPALAEGATRVA
jgi:UDP-2,3-diacylglucosamine pyrophosphatase LpxH